MIHQQLVCDLHLLIVLSSGCICVTAADDQPIGDERLTHQIVNSSKGITESWKIPNPLIFVRQGKLVHWSTSCHLCCLNYTIRCLNYTKSHRKVLTSLKNTKSWLFSAGKKPPSYHLTDPWTMLLTCYPTPYRPKLSLPIVYPRNQSYGGIYQRGISIRLHSSILLTHLYGFFFVEKKYGGLTGVWMLSQSNIITHSLSSHQPKKYVRPEFSLSST